VATPPRLLARLAGLTACSGDGGSECRCTRALVSCMTLKNHSGSSGAAVEGDAGAPALPGGSRAGTSACDA